MRGKNKEADWISLAFYLAVKAVCFMMRGDTEITGKDTHCSEKTSSPHTRFKVPVLYRITSAEPRLNQ